MPSATLLLPLSLALGVIPAERTLLDRVVAVVNDEVVTLSELERVIEPFLGEDTTPERKAGLYQEAIDQLIAEKLLEQQIREAHIEVSPDDVERAIDDITRQNKLTRDDLKQAIEGRGMTMARYKEDLEKQLIRLKLIDLKIRSRVVVPEADVRAEWERQAGLEKREKQVHLRHLYFAWGESPDPTERTRVLERAKKARDRVAKGEDFAVVAKEVSDGPTGAQGGDLGWFSETNLLPELARAVIKLKVGQISEPITTPGGVHVVRIEESRLKEPTGYEEAHGPIYQRLYQAESERQMKVWLDEVRSQSSVQVRLPK